MLIPFHMIFLNVTLVVHHVNYIVLYSNALTVKNYSGIDSENQQYQIYRKGCYNGYHHTGPQTWYAYFAC